MRELDLGEAGEAYVRRRLESGSLLSRAVLRHSQAITAHPVALLPVGTNLERALRFDEGGILPRQPAIAELVTRLDGALSTTGAIFVAEDTLLRRGDPVLAQSPVPVSFFRDEVYLWTNEPPRVPEVLRATRSHFLNCFVTLADGLSTELSEAALDSLGRATSIVVINAYDREGFVLCRASGQATTR